MVGPGTLIGGYLRVDRETTPLTRGAGRQRRVPHRGACTHAILEGESEAAVVGVCVVGPRAEGCGYGAVIWELISKALRGICELASYRN